MKQAGNQLAIRVDDVSMTYSALHSAALHWAGALPRGPVAVLAGRSAEAYIGVLACVYAGVPVVPLVADFPVARTARMLEAAGVTTVLVDREGLDHAPESRIPVIDLRVGRTHAALTAPRSVHPTDVAYVLFTSGSTGRPKGVRLTYGNLAHYFSLMDPWYDFTAIDVFAQAAGLNWDSAVSDLWCAWGRGAGLVSVPTPAYRDLPVFVRRNGITVWFSAPSVISLVRRTGRLEPGSMPSLRWTFFGGEALTCADAAAWQAAAPGSAVVNVYGPTESTITTHRHTWRPDVSTLLAVNGIVPLGTVHPGHSERVVDGELWIAGPQVSPGYVDPADDVGRFVTGEERTWYRTGDRVDRAGGGELRYLGRIDAQVQVGGYRVELAEVDHALRGVSGVVDGVTVGARVGGATTLMAFYTGSVVSPAVLARRLAKVLPRQLIPRHYQHMDAFPLNRNQKIDRLALTETANELLADELPA
jgi:amino acid adenylation domain-containing protein